MPTKIAIKENGIEPGAGQFFEALRFKPEVRGFDSRFCHWNF